jgi:hypothetical protein
LFIEQNISIEALLPAERSEMVRSALGDHLFAKGLENKKVERDRFRAHVSQLVIASLPADALSAEKGE